jgi:uncharacterized membrane protein
LTDEVRDRTPPAKRPQSRAYSRDSVEFGRALSFFDATYAVALTLLVTTIAGASKPSAWRNLHSLVAADGTHLIAFAVSFAVVSGYWLANHQFAASLARISVRLIVANLVLLAAVVILPFSTEALGAFRLPLSTAIYAVNVALISILEAALFILAWADGMLEPAPARRDALISLVPQAVTPVVFLASVPIAYLVSSAAGRMSWLSLLFLGPLVGTWAKRAATPTSERQ